MAKSRWIQKAIKRPGAFRAKAKRAGMTTREYAQRVIRNPSRYDTRTIRQAHLALRLMAMSKRRRKRG